MLIVNLPQLSFFFFPDLRTVCGQNICTVHSRVLWLDTVFKYCLCVFSDVLGSTDLFGSSYLTQLLLWNSNTVDSSMLQGVVLLIILISGLCCMMGIDTPTRFEVAQDSWFVVRAKIRPICCGAGSYILGHWWK